VDEAEAAIAAAKKAHATDLAELTERESALARERRDREEKKRQELERLEKQLAKAQARYEEAIEKWRS
jgi:hypothetical protein